MTVCVCICTYITIFLVCKLTVTHDDSVKPGCCTRHTDNKNNLYSITKLFKAIITVTIIAGHDTYIGTN